MKSTPVKIRVGSRASPLALAQVEEVRQALAKAGKAVDFQVKTYDTRGDLDQKTPLRANLRDDFFTDALDRALLKGEIDIAIHSAKDLPQKLNPNLALFALTKALDETDAFIGAKPLNKLPQGARVGTSSALRRQKIKELNAGVKAVSIRGNIGERLARLDKGLYDGIIVATCALKRLGLSRRITSIMPWEAAALQGQLAVVGRAEERKHAALFSCLDIRKNYGRVFLVGAGPGDPGLITVKATEFLKKSDVVFYDYLVNKELLKYARKAKKIYAGKRKGAHSIPQHALNTMIKNEAVKGGMVVRLKGGDPLIFGRGADEIAYLQSYHVPVCVIPGVSSATAIPTELGIPLTARGISNSVAFISGHHERDGKRKSSIQIPDVKTVVMLMSLTRLKEAVSAFKRKKWPAKTPVAVISKGTTKTERIVRSQLSRVCQEVQNARLKPPALVIIGETVRFFDEQQRCEKTILYTGTNPQKYRKLGKIIHIPMIHLKKAPLTKKQQEELRKNFKLCCLVVLTSRFGVDCFFKALKELKISPQDFQNKPYAVIGTATADALTKAGIIPTLVAAPETSEGLFRRLSQKYNLKGLRVLLPRSALPNPVLKTLLKKSGALVKEVTIYRNSKPRRRALPRAGVTEVIFTSPSTVNNFLKDYGAIPGDWKIKSRGPRTARTLKGKGFKSKILN